MANKLNIGLSAVATGTANAITATYSPAITLTDRRIVFLRITTPNTTTTPTFNPNSLGAKTITKLGGDALNAGDLQGDCILMYDLTNTRWELITAKASVVSPDGLKTVVATDSFARVLATNSSTIEAYLFADLLKAQLYYYDDDNAGGNVYIDKDRLTLTHDVLVNVVATNFRLSSETASRVAILDANKNLKGADTTTYPSLTELSYVKGVTSAIQPQLNSKKDHALFFSLGSNTVGDLQTYYFGQMFGTLATTTNQSGATPIRAGVITGAIIATFNGSTVGSNESCTLSLSHGTSFATTDQITNALTVNANRQAVLPVAGLNITVTDCNALMKLETPSIGTNPTGWQIRIILIYQ